MRIYLAHLVHMRNGKPVTEGLPLNIGCLATYLQREFGGKVEVELFSDPVALDRAMERSVPDLLGLSNYIWSARLNLHYAEHYKVRHPGLTVVMGGPNFPGREDLQERFLRAHPYVDCFIRGDGEKPLAHVVRSLTAKEDPAAAAHPGLYALRKGRMIAGGWAERITDPAESPSPYLAGLLDSFLEAGYAPVLQTNRGCPFRCGYCHSGNAYYSRLLRFGEARVRDELRYMAARAKMPLLHVADDNYGLFEEDVERSAFFLELRRARDWPLRMFMSTAKVNLERVARCLEALGDIAVFSASLQSTHPPTLTAIERTNLSLAEQARIVERVNRSGAVTISELIFPLPAETPASHRDGIRQILAAGISSVDVYTTMLLPATPLTEGGAREAYEMECRFRALPRDFGSYHGRTIVEFEEVCVGTTHVSFTDYLDARGLHFVLSFFHNKGFFRPFVEAIRARGHDLFAWLCALQEALAADRGPAGEVYAGFRRETADELWPDGESLRAALETPEGLRQLEAGERGANLIQKYTALALARFDECSRLAARTFSLIAGGEDSEGLSEGYRLLSVGQYGALLDPAQVEREETLPFDPHRELRGDPEGDTGRYRVRFRMPEEKAKTIADYLEFFGHSSDAQGKILTRINPAMFRREVVAVAKVE